MTYFATEYTIHFDDTMAYGSHHFLTSFKFQCAARESFLFGERVFDVAGVREALDRIHLFTSDAYARNFHPAKLGDRIAILLTLEDWGRVSARFCYRVVNANGEPISAGFQTLICADAETGEPIPLPSPLQLAMDAMREIEEPAAEISFRDRVLAGGHQADSLFDNTACATAKRYLLQRYPSPGVIAAADTAVDTLLSARPMVQTWPHHEPTTTNGLEVWTFSGQGSWNAGLLGKRIIAAVKAGVVDQKTLDRCANVAHELIGGDAAAMVSGSIARSAEAIEHHPELSQVAIYLQNLLGALLRQSRGHRPDILMGHSFGEIAALGFSGCFDLPTGVHVVCERVRAVREFAPADGGLLVVTSDRHTVATEAAVIGLHDIVIAGRNHEQQTVASGACEDLDRLQRHLRAAHIDAITISTPTSFHHPRLRSASTAWLAQLRRLALAGPAVSVYSPIGRRFVSPEDEIAAILASQFLRPFDLQGSVQDLVRLGATRFVDCGTTGALSRLIALSGPEGLEVCHLDEPAIFDAAIDAASHPARPLNGHHVSSKPQHDASRGGLRLPAVAILGQGCALPGGALGPERLFSAIMQQRLGIVDQRSIDPHWARDFYSEELVPDRSTTPLSGIVNDADFAVPPGVDANVFHRLTRTQQLLCIALAPCVASLEGAQRVLCLVGASADGFEDQDAVSSLRFAKMDPTDHDVDSLLETARSAFQEPHAAIQEVFDCIVRPGLNVILIDAACASSLYAVALGVLALEADRADAVIAGGVFCPGPGNSCLFSQFRGSTSTGCRPFDADADGVAFSEGSALVTLRRVADAERLNLPISAVVSGVGLSSDGKSSSANVPQSKGQLLSLQRCYSTYGIDPATIQAIEAHGTSTPVGDSTELETLRQFFADRVPQPIAVHSLKGLLGHAGWASGTASVLAACQYLKNGIFPAQAFHRQPSAALVNAAGTLTISNRPVPLPSGPCRVAVDGFGFGGANAHLVIERYAPIDSANEAVLIGESRSADREQDLVFVAFDQFHPSGSGPCGPQFDRGKLELPTGMFLLPDLAEDIDVSQMLAISLVDRILARLPTGKDDLRRGTSLVIALSGKTERGVEATLRVLAPRFRRHLKGCDSLIDRLDSAVNSARPSGPYTLQGMMPNVAAGRAALQSNLNGPNFVVDAGANSLEAALESAKLLLAGGKECGTALAIVAAINANPWRVPDRKSHRPEGEFAIAVAMTTRQYADAAGLQIMAEVEPVLRGMLEASKSDQSVTSTAAKAEQLIAALAPPSPPKTVTVTTIPPPASVAAADAQYPLHTPVWIEAPLPARQPEIKEAASQAIVVIARSDREQIVDLTASLSHFERRWMMVVVGQNATEIAAAIVDRNVVAVDLNDEHSIANGIERIAEFQPDVVVAAERIRSWILTDVISQAACDNEVCEMLFLVAQRNVDRLTRGELELWGLFAGGWNQVVHPASGPIAGMLKSIKREFADAHVGTICTRSASWSAAWHAILEERRHKVDEQEVVHDEGIRRVRRLRPTSFGESEPLSPPVALDANSVIIATGGAHGVTGVMIDALLRDHQCTIVAIGRSPLEPGPVNADSVDAESDFYQQFMLTNRHASAKEMKRAYELARARWEAHQTMEQLATLGGKVEYLEADVTKPDQIAEVMRHVKAKFGRLDLIVHGAGVQWSKRLANRTLSEFRTTFSVKVAGLYHLMHCSHAEFGKIVPMHALTSAYSVFGNDGQHDYGAANETMDRLCGLAGMLENHGWSSIAWLAWDGVGMTRGREYRALAEQRGLSCLDVESGQQIFRQVFSGSTRATINVPISATEHVTYEVKTVPMASRAAGGRMREIAIDLATIPCLPFHTVRTVPTLPGAWILDLMVHAALPFAEDISKANVVSLENVNFKRFVRFAPHVQQGMRVVAEETALGIRVWMIGDVRHPSGVALERDVVYAHATVSFACDASYPQPRLDKIDWEASCQRRQFVEDPYCSGQRADVNLSGPFDCLREIVISPSGRYAKFAPDLNMTDWSGDTPALLLDAAWRVGAMHANPQRDELFVPVCIKRLVLPLGMRSNSSAAAGWDIRSTAPRIDGRNVSCDRTEVTNSNGVRLLVEGTTAISLE